MSTGRIVHLGLGNFHRAHQAVYTAAAGGWEITAVARGNRRLVDALRAQDLRYTVVTMDGDEVRVEPVDVITEALVAADDPEGVVDRIADPGTAVVTLTVTEAGYTPDGPLIDLLRRGVGRRDGAPVTLVSCDNVHANGDVLRDVLGLDAPGVAYPSTMVDRIVPATTAEHVALARAAGYDDAVPVPAEPFRQWVIQPDFAGDRPAWDRGGAVFGDDVAAWETVKVRMLNGTHSLLAYLGLLDGRELIADAIGAPGIRAASAAVGDEYAATLDVPAGLDLADYRAQLAARFANRALGHRTDQVGTDGSLKLVQRVPAPARWHLERGHVPSALALTVAAFAACWCRDVPLAGSPRDPAADALRELGRRNPGPHDLATAVVELVFGEAIGDPRFDDRVGELLGVLDRHGVDAAVDETLRSG